MPRGKYLTTTELNDIKSFVDEGLTYKEIGELVGRSAHAVEVAVSRYGLKKKQEKSENKPASQDWDAILKEPELPMVEEVVQEGPKPVVIQKPVKEKTLNDFPARELIKNLYDRGYRIRGNEWKLVCLVEQVVNHIDIIKNG